MHVASLHVVAEWACREDTLQIQINMIECDYCGLHHWWFGTTESMSRRIIAVACEHIKNRHFPEDINVIMILNAKLHELIWRRWCRLLIGKQIGSLLFPTRSIKPPRYHYWWLLSLISLLPTLYCMNGHYILWGRPAFTIDKGCDTIPFLLLLILRECHSSRLFR